MPPIVSIVGRSGSGKTTLVEKLVPELASRGYRVATVKHAPKDDIGDAPGKDSWRHLQAGSAATVIAASRRYVLFRPAAGETTLEEAARLLGEEHDVIIAEGFKHGDGPSIEVHRQQVGPLLDGTPRPIAIATDETLEVDIRQFSLDDVAGLTDLIERDIIRPSEERVALYVNDAPIPLTVFPQQMVSAVATAMAAAAAACLRGVKEIRTMSIFIRRSTGGRGG